MSKTQRAKHYCLGSELHRPRFLHVAAASMRWSANFGYSSKLEIVAPMLGLAWESFKKVAASPSSRGVVELVENTAKKK